MANENLGDIQCPLCKSPAHMRRYNARKPAADGVQRGKFYIHCDDCGPILTSGPKAQEYILNNGKVYGASKTEPAIPARPEQQKQQAAPVPAAKPDVKPAQASAPKKTSVWDNLL